MKGRSGPRSPAAVRPRIKASYLDEPFLEFAGGAEDRDQKTGLARYGPASLGEPRHPTVIKLGFIGSGKSIQLAKDWFKKAEAGVRGDPDKKILAFPGFSSDVGFFSSFVRSSEHVEVLSTHEMDDIVKQPRVAARFDAAVALLSEKLRLLRQQDDRPQVAILALPDELILHTKRVRFNDPELGLVYRNFRRTLKAELMRHDIPTQIMLERVSRAEEGDKDIDHPSRIAWNLCTSLFYKGGGIPWRPIGLRPDTCYIGISFHRVLGSGTTDLQSSVAQAFDENGTGLVLRGPDFPWDARNQGPAPHLDADQARALLSLVLKRYVDETHRLPARVVVHKTSRFTGPEREGIKAALDQIRQFDLVALAPTSAVRLVRAGRYPPLRGTLFSLGDAQYLYTTGYITSLNEYPHGHVPSPLQIADHHGDSSVEELAREILLLTKMNWNSAGFAGAMPITVRFSRLVGEIMREVPQSREPQPQFKFYT
jgi:hypothetical protein